MLTGRRRSRSRRSRAARIAAPLAIPMALGLTLGVVIAASGNHTAKLAQSTANSKAVSQQLRDQGAAATFDSGPIAPAQLGDLATAPVDGTGQPIDMNQTPSQAATTMNCTLAVPDHPLTARGLATPYVLGDGCDEANTLTEGAFVEATILAPDGSVQVYNPLVITAGTTPAKPPLLPHVERGSHVIIDIGFNGTNLVLTGRGASQGHCVDALGQSVLGQVSACNAVSFYQAANAAIAAGRLKIPAAGMAQDGQPCPTSRSFALVDQDQSDNVVSQYLLTADGRTAQNTAANAAALSGAQVVTNGSDDALLSEFVDPAIGCTPYEAPDMTNPHEVSPSQALNELSARVNQQEPVALVPPNDEMTLVHNVFSIAKTNVYRSLVDQPLLPPGTDPAAVAAAYCQNLVNFAPARDALDMSNDAAMGSPVPAVGSNLATFLGARLSMSFVNLGCARFALTMPVTTTAGAGGVTIKVSYATLQQVTDQPGASISSPSR